MTVLSKYPYLVVSLVLLKILIAGLLVGAGQRRLSLLSALLSAPFAFASVFYVPEYWNPVRVVSFLAGPEDLIFSFATGGMSWLVAVWWVRHRLTINLHPRRLAVRYLTWTVPGTAMFFAVGAVNGADVMARTLVSIAVVGAALAWSQRELWPIPVAGGFGFTLMYSALTGASLLVWPDFIRQWNAANLWGPHFAGVPLEEILWAVGYGAVWPLLMAYVFGARLQRAPARGLLAGTARAGK